MSRPYRILAVVAVLVAASALLWGSLDVGKAEYDRYSRALEDVARLDAALDNGVLGIQTLVEDDYDRITELQRELREVRTAFADRDDVLVLEREIERKLDLIEKYKSRHAIFRNSFHAIPALEDELRQLPAYPAMQSADGALAAAQWATYRALFIDRNEGGLPVEHAMDQLARNRLFEPVHDAVEWELLVAHMTKLAAVTAEQRGITRELFGISLHDQARLVRSAVDFEYTQRFERSQLFQMGSFGLSLILLLLVAKAVSSVLRHRQQLEARVAERTRELAEVNETLKDEMQSKENIQKELLQAQKLEAVGQLSAGIAHEINTPTQYVGDNIRFLQDSFADVLRVLGAVEERSKSEAAEADAEPAREADEVDIEFLREEIPRAISESVEGIDRVSSIVRALKDFSHPSKSRIPEDLNRAIESTAIVARNEWKYVADLELDLDRDLPPIPCVLSEFNQVILNLIVNASHAVKSVVGDGGAKGRIRISTRLSDGEAQIAVEDSGAGIPKDIVDRVFEPFFTTKPVGAGTGQGLAIAHNVIVEKHGGTLAVDSEPDTGTTFTIRLPADEPADTRSVAEPRVA